MATSVQSIVHRHRTLILYTLYGLALIVVACLRKPQRSKVPYYDSASFTPVWTMPDRYNDTLHTVGAFRFTNQLNETVTEQTLRGKIYLASFFFTSCAGICPRMTNNMRLVYERFKGNYNVAFLCHSVQPETDSPARLREYAQHQGLLNPQWHFVTGTTGAIYTIARKGYFVEEAPGLSKDSTEFLHTENLILIDKQGHIRGLYNGTLQAEVPRISEDIAALLQE